MSTRTQVPAGARCVARATSEFQEVEIANGMTQGRIVVELFQGEYSKGYQSNYERIPTRWLVIAARDSANRVLRFPPQYKGDRGELRRRCQAFSGKRYELAAKTYADIAKRDKLTEEANIIARVS